MDYETLQVERNGAVLTVAMNRPKRMNAMSRAMCNDLFDVFNRHMDDRDLRCVVVTGRGNGFCAGGDMTEFLASVGDGAHPPVRQELEVLPLTERQLRAQEGAAGGHDHDGDELFSSLSPTTHRLFHPPGPPAVKLRISHPDGEEERWFLADSSGAAGWSDGRFHMAFGTTPDEVAEWRSLLVVGEGEAAERHVVRVNHPLSYQGWTFYQHDADPKRPDYSGILAVYDPGWPLVAVALLLVSLGVAGMFWVQPFLRRRPGVERRRP